MTQIKKTKMELTEENIEKAWESATLLKRIAELERRVEELEGQFRKEEELPGFSDLDGVWCNCNRQDAHTVGEHLNQHDKALAMFLSLEQIDVFKKPS